MNLYRPEMVKCLVCGAQTKYHASWFLVVENRWLDRLKILAWHSKLAEKCGRRSVCGDRHLKILLQHWLNEANLDLHYTETTSGAAWGEDRESAELRALAAGNLLGELAVHRHPLSRVWTGSPETFECILSAITGREAKARASDLPLTPLQARQPDPLSRAHIAGWA